ncbi:MAG TPA: FAD-dependent oxidoreductase [Acidimicrobiales bacterium]
MEPRPALSSHLDVDVAIVGGGFTGLWTARELKRRDPALRIAVLEQAVCGFGASGRNGGWASSFYPLSDEAIVARHGHDSFRHLRRVLQEGVTRLGAAMADDGIDGDFIQGGTLNFARSDIQAERLRRHVQESRELGYREEDLRWLDESEANQRAVVTGTRGASYSPHCARLHPAKLVRGLAQVNERLGVDIFENTKITRIVGATGRRPAQVVSPSANVHARYVVRATEGFTPSLPGARRSVAPLYSLMIATSPQSQSFWDQVGLSGHETFSDERHLIIYGQRTRDNRFAFGGRGAPYHFGSAVEPRFDSNAKVFALLEATLRELFPLLEGTVTHRWGGPLAMARDQSPSVLVDHASGLASAGGYTGDGVVMTHVAATALADLICTPETPSDYSVLPFVQHRSKRWEVEPFRWLGINAALSAADRADRAEAKGKSEGASSRLLARLMN